MKYFAPLFVLLLIGCGVGEKVKGLVGSEESVERRFPLEELTSSADVKVRKVWSRNIGAGTDGQYLELIPAISDERIFVADSRGRIAALSAANGKTVWDRNTKLPFTGGVGSGQTLILAGTREGEVIAFGPESGDELWSSRVSSEVLAPPQQGGDIVVVRTNDGRIFALDADKGDRLWTYERTVPPLTLRGNGVPIISENTVIAGFDGGRIAALDRQTGQVIWETTIAVASGRTELERMVDIDIKPAIIEEIIYVATFQGRIAAITLDNGFQLWNREISSFAGLGVDRNRVYVTDDQSHIWSLDRFTGAIIWKQVKLQARSATAPATIGDMLVVGDGEGYLHWMDKLSGEFVARTRAANDPIIVPPIVAGEVVYAYSSNGRLSAYIFNDLSGAE